MTRSNAGGGGRSPPKASTRARRGPTRGPSWRPVGAAGGRCRRPRPGPCGRAGRGRGESLRGVGPAGRVGAPPPPVGGNPGVAAGGGLVRPGPAPAAGHGRPPTQEGGAPTDLGRALAGSADRLGGADRPLVRGTE